MKHGKALQGFTLVELLVVIAIVILLAAIVIPAVKIGIQHARKVRAQTEMSNISSAIRAYYKEYGVMPTPDTNGLDDHTFGLKNGISPRYQNQVMDILRDVESTRNPDHQYNLRRIVFLEVPLKSMSGTDFNGTEYKASDGYYLDPWGTPYVICMDTDYDKEIGGIWVEQPMRDYLTALSPVTPATDRIFPGVIAGVMSFGSEPTEQNSCMVSWGIGQK